MPDKIKKVFLGPGAKAAGSTIGIGASIAGLFFGLLHWGGIQPPLEVITYGSGVIIFMVNRLVSKYFN